MDKFSSMSELLRALPAKGNYAIYADESRNSAVKVFAPHGGCIEPGTEPLVLALARDRYDYFVFSGIRATDCNRVLHVTSTRYDEPSCLRMAEAAELAVAIHGSAERDERLQIGGGNGELASVLLESLRREGYPAVPAAEGIAGSAPANFINRALRKGIQLELSAGFRKRLYPSFPKTLQRNEPEIRKFLGALTSFLSEADIRRAGPAVS